MSTNQITTSTKERVDSRSSLARSLAGMRTLVGIDADELYIPAMKLLGRLNFAGNHVTLAHVDAPPGAVLNPSPLVYAYYDVAELEARMRNAGENLLDEAADCGKKCGLGAGIETEYALGHSSVTLMSLADVHQADLVVVGSGRLGPLGSFFLGSVGRALAINGKQSFLVGRNDDGRDGPVSAVFATDFSEYAERAFLRLLDMNPQGLGKVTLVTATDPKMETQLARETGVYNNSANPLTEIEQRMRECGERMVGRLKARGIEAEFKLVEGHAAETVRDTMSETGSDLLILGAQGHGLIERIFIGSLALHQVVAEPYSVLVLRMPEEN